jgi:hypothetical protein
MFTSIIPNTPQSLATLGSCHRAILMSIAMKVRVELKDWVSCFSASN